MSDDSDDEIQHLIDLSNKGDKEARGRLIEFTASRVHKLARTMLADFPGVQRWEQTDDVFVKALKRLDSSLDNVELTSPRHFFNLAAMQVRRVLLDLKKHYYGPLGIGTNHHTDHQPPDESGGRLSKAASQSEELERWEALHEAAARLSEELREVFNLVYYQGLTKEEVARILGVHLSTVKRRWQEAKLRLHDELADES
jgi:RNA polymerase sigma factor (sigma-70 family)